MDKIHYRNILGYAKILGACTFWVLTIIALICWFPGTQNTNTGNPGRQVNYWGD